MAGRGEATFTITFAFGDPKPARGMRGALHRSRAASSLDASFDSSQTLDQTPKKKHSTRRASQDHVGEPAHVCRVQALELKILAFLNHLSAQFRVEQPLRRAASICPQGQRTIVI